MMLNYISIIASSIKSVDFYKRLGFKVKEVMDRGYDVLYLLEQNNCVLKIYIDDNHPKRQCNPECLGLRSLCFNVCDIYAFSLLWDVELKEDKKGLFCYIYDPDNLPIEIRKEL